MIEIKIGERVELKLDVPEKGLRIGESGLVCSTWFSPNTFYEVEFQRETPEGWIRVLLMSNQIKGVGMSVLTR